MGMFFKKRVFNSLKTIDDYKNNGYKKEPINRGKIKICFIDDKGFNSELFRKTGYNDVDYRLDFTNLNDVQAYDIVACDIDGIGIALDKKRQGLAVAETIATRYPEKIVLIYSSNNPYEYSEDYHSVGDGFFNKSISFNEMAKKFDQYGAVFFDEIAAWKKIEKQLRKDSIANKTIAFIEDLYVRSLEDKINLFESDKSDKKLKLVIEASKFILSIATIVSRFI